MPENPESTLPTEPDDTGRPAGPALPRPPHRTLGDVYSRIDEHLAEI